MSWKWVISCGNELLNELVFWKYEFYELKSTKWKLTELRKFEKMSYEWVEFSNVQLSHTSDQERSLEEHASRTDVWLSDSKLVKLWVSYSLSD